MACDLSHNAARDSFVADASAELGGLDVLCNVAGVQQFAEIGKITPAGLRKHFDVTALAVIPGFLPPEDVAEALLYLASDVARSVTAANPVVDRGVVW